MSATGRPRLLVIRGDNVPGDIATRPLIDLFEVMSVDHAELATLSPKGLAGAIQQGYQVICCDLSLISPSPGSGTSGALVVPEHPQHPVLPGLTEREAGAALSSIGEGVCVCSMEGQLVWANDRFRAYDDQTRARITAVCRRAAVTFEEQLLEQEAAGFSAGSQKFEVASPDESRFYEIVVSPIRHDSATGGPGRVERVAAVVWDVTHSRRSQQKMDAIDRAGAELVRLDAEQIRKRHAAERLKVLEDKIFRFSHELLHFDHLAVRLVDERTGRLELLMHRGLPPEATEIELYAQKEGNGIMGFVAATGRSYLCPDVSKDRRYVTGLHGARSSLTVPLRLHDKVIGAFNVESERIAAFTEEDRQFAEIFAHHVAMAIHMLNLLVVERCATGETVTGTVQGEIKEPLEDIVKHAEWLKQAAEKDPALKDHVDRILSDVAAIQERVSDAASGPQTILGAERALADLTIDPLLSGKNVLVADDEPKMRQIIRDVLRGKGCRVTVCTNGAMAIAELQASQKGAIARFDLVVSDIKMPDKNGYEVFSAAKKVDAALPVILMTGFGYDPHHSIVRASQEGLSCVLFKPFQIDRLMEEVRKALGQLHRPVGSA
jgi:CheY-like chemotaxis protein/putative methionine-R-sulfoxide reductase with GAF domain